MVTGFDASIAKTNSRAQYSFQASDWLQHAARMMCAIYSTRLALFIHGITFSQGYLSEKITHCLQSIRWIHVYLLIFKFQKGSIEALNFLIITS